MQLITPPQTLHLLPIFVHPYNRNQTHHPPFPLPHPPPSMALCFEKIRRAPSPPLTTPTPQPFVQYQREEETSPSSPFLHCGALFLEKNNKKIITINFIPYPSSLLELLAMAETCATCGWILLLKRYFTGVC